VTAALAVALIDLQELRSVPRTEVFPIETLAPQERILAEKWLLRLMDSEALYTLVGGLKPMSSGWISLDSRKGLMPFNVEQAQRVLSKFTVGKAITASLLPFAKTYNEKRTLEGYVFHTGAFMQAVEARQRLFSYFSITPQMPPGEAILAFDSDASTDRFRAYGHLFGYPDYAVEFFAQASDTQQADPEKKLVPRDFLSVPTFGRQTNQFVYAVPKGHTARPEDEEIRKKAAPILAMYRGLRSKWIQKDGRGSVGLLRDWMCKTDSECSP